VEVVSGFQAERRGDPILANGTEIYSAVRSAETSGVEMVDTATAEDSKLKCSDHGVELPISRYAIQIEMTRKEARLKSVITESSFCGESVDKSKLETGLSADSGVKEVVEITMREIGAKTSEDSEASLRYLSVLNGLTTKLSAENLHGNSWISSGRDAR